MVENKSQATRRAVGNILGIIAGIIGMYLGFTKSYAENIFNIAIVIIGAGLIAVNLSMLKSHFYRKKG